MEPDSRQAKRTMEELEETDAVSHLRNYGFRLERARKGFVLAKASGSVVFLVTRQSPHHPASSGPPTKMYESVTLAVYSVGMNALEMTLQFKSVDDLTAALSAAG